MSLSENAKAGRLDNVDTTLYTMILDSSAVRKDGTSCQRCKSEHHLVRDCSFRRNHRWRRIRAARKWARERQETKVNNGNTRNDLQTTLRAAIYSSGKLANKEPNASEPIHARLIGGTTLGPIANLLPAPKSPFTTSIWKHNLTDYADQAFADELLHDIDNGVRIGFIGNRSSLISPNHFSAISNPEAIAHELEREISLNRKIGPFLSPPFEHFVGSPKGAVPKKRSMPVKWRIINDLSWPAGLSVNDGIPKDSLSCTCDMIDKAIAHLKSAGKGALMSKLDLSDAFRHILIHPTTGSC